MHIHTSIIKDNDIISKQYHYIITIILEKQKWKTVIHLVD